MMYGIGAANPTVVIPGAPGAPTSVPPTFYTPPTLWKPSKLPTDVALPSAGGSIPSDDDLQKMAEPYVGPRAEWGPVFEGAFACFKKGTASIRAGGSPDAAATLALSCVKDLDKKAKAAKGMLVVGVVGALAVCAGIGWLLHRR